MTELFLNILNASFAGSWVVLVVILARLVLKKAPRWVVCALWALVAVRLLWPILPQSPISLIPSAEIIAPDSLYAQAPVIHSGLTVLDNAVNPAYTASLRPAPGASVNPLQVWLAVFANLWVLGAVLMGLWALVSCLRVRRLVRESIRERDNIFLCDRMDSPFIFGLLRPKIYLPSSLSDGDKRHVLAHEMAHLHRRDHWWKPLGFLLLTIHWFNPSMWLAYLLLCRDIEMATDERVVRELSLADKKSYSSALLSCSVSRRRIAACPLAFGEVDVKQRVKSVLHYRKPAFRAVLVSLVLVGLLAACTLTNPPEQVSELYYNGDLYVLEQQEVSYLPEDESIGTLRSILHNTTEHPTEELQATNLDEYLAGCPLYLEENRLYLQKFDGTCIAFRRLEDNTPR